MPVFTSYFPMIIEKGTGTIPQQSGDVFDLAYWIEVGRQQIADEVGRIGVAAVYGDHSPEVDEMVAKDVARRNAFLAESRRREEEVRQAAQQTTQPVGTRHTRVQRRRARHGL